MSTPPHTVKSSSIRVIAICVFAQGNRILAAPCLDEVKGERFFRPLGGAVEFGEAAIDALRREIREEVQREITAPLLIGVLENRFDYRGQPGHEVVFVFDAQFVDASLYMQPTVPLVEPGWEGDAVWIDPQAPLLGRLYPDGLARLLKDHESK